MVSRREFIKNFSASALFLFPLSLAGRTVQGVRKMVNPKFNETQEKEFWQKVRQEFMLDPQMSFFNTGTLGAMPRRVFERTVNHLRLTAEKIAEWDYYGADWISGYQPWTEIRQKAARLINCDVKELALTENATAGMNYISNGLDLKAGDEVFGH
jgi:isopenicillin-N epimerase